MFSRSKHISALAKHRVFVATKRIWVVANNDFSYTITFFVATKNNRNENVLFVAQQCETDNRSACRGPVQEHIPLPTHVPEYNFRSPLVFKLEA